MDTSTPRWFRIGLSKSALTRALTSALWAFSLAAAWLLLSIAFGLGAPSAHAADDDDTGASTSTKSLLGAVVKTLDDTLDKTTDTVAKVTDTVGTVTDTVEETTKTVTKTVSTVTESVTKVAEAEPVKVVTKTVTETVSSVPVVGKVADDLKVTKTVEKTGAAVSDAVTDLVTTVDNTVDRVVDTVDKVVGTVDDVVDTVVDAVVTPGAPPLPSSPTQPSTPVLPDHTAPDTSLPHTSDESTAPASPSAPPADPRATGGNLIEDATPVAAWASWRTAGAVPPAPAVAPRGSTVTPQHPLHTPAPVGFIALCTPAASGLGSSSSPFGADVAPSAAQPFAQHAWLRALGGPGPQPPVAPPAAPDVSPD